MPQRDPCAQALAVVGIIVLGALLITLMGAAARRIWGCPCDNKGSSSSSGSAPSKSKAVNRRKEPQERNLRSVDDDVVAAKPPPGAVAGRQASDDSGTKALHPAYARGLQTRADPSRGGMMRVDPNAAKASKIEQTFEEVQRQALRETKDPDRFYKKPKIAGGAVLSLK